MNERFNEFLHWNIYQIYPKSFKDSNGDGIGDIPGIIEKLDYLKELGVNAIWLCPCYVSPQDDGGYDIADFRAIAPEYGTLEDWKKLRDGLHARGMKIIMDLVANHTSTSHRWFQESRKSKDNPYSDYYYWFDQIPNDWESCFLGSAYAFDEMRGQYYLHSYALSQADLNMDHPQVLKEMQDIIDYWANLGADGFRCDVIDQISKDWEGNRNCFGPHLHEYIHSFFSRPESKHLFTVGECWANTTEEIIRHCGEDRGELTTLFQFDHQQMGRTTKWERAEPSLKTYRDILVHDQELAQDNGIIASLFTDNHDNSYLLSRMEKNGLHYEFATLLAGMTYLLRGIPFIYQGIEFGMEASECKSIDEFRDVESLNYYKENIELLGEKETLTRVNFGSRDNSRHPLSWDGTENVGFTTGTPWIEPATNSKEFNLKKDMADEKSVFRFYKELLALRNNHEAFTTGYFQNVSEDDNSFVYIRGSDAEKFMIICNFDKSLSLTKWKIKGVALSNMGRTELPKELNPYEVLVVELCD